MVIKQDSRARTIAAARELFAAKGFHGTAMSELAAHARVSVGQIYRLFESKGAIIQAIVDDDAKEKLARIRAITTAARAGKISIERAFETLLCQSPSGRDEALSLEILAEAHRNPRLARSLDELCGRYRPALHDLVLLANARLSATDGRAAEELLLACLLGLGRLPPAQSHLDSTVRKAARILLDGMRAMTCCGAPAIEVAG